MNNYGVKCRFRVFETSGVTVAVLLCQTRHGGHIGLFLKRDLSGLDATRPRYHTGCLSQRTDMSFVESTARLLSLGDDLLHLSFNGKPVKTEWRTIYIVAKPPAQFASQESVFTRLTINCGPQPPFRFPNWLLAKLSAGGFLFRQDTAPSLDWAEPQRMTFVRPKQLERFHVDMGICHNDQAHTSLVHWARVRIFGGPNRLKLSPAVRQPADDPHECSEDHIDLWDGSSKTFGDSQRSVRLSLFPCKRSPQTTFIVHLELGGVIYERIFRNARVDIPSLSDVCS